MAFCALAVALMLSRVMGGGFWSEALWVKLIVLLFLTRVLFENVRCESRSTRARARARSAVRRAWLVSLF